MLNVMLVDDDRMVINDLRTLISWEEQGFSIRQIQSNGARALTAIQENKPDVIITDIIMPVMDGIELLKAVKASWPEIVVVLLSSYSEFSYAKDAIKFGGFDYILKDEINSTSLIQLLDRVREHISSASSVQATKDEREIYHLFHNAAAADVKSPSDPKGTLRYYLLGEMDFPYPTIWRNVMNSSPRYRISEEELAHIKSFQNTSFSIRHIVAISERTFIMELDYYGNDHYPLPALTSFVRQIQGSFQEKFHRFFSVFYLLQKTDRRTAANLYTARLHDIQNKYFWGIMMFMDLNDTVLHKEGDFNNLDYDRLELAITGRNTGDLYALLDEWFGEILQKRDIDGFTALIEACLFLLKKHQRRDNLPDFISETPAERCLEFTEIRFWLRSLFEQYFNLLQSSLGMSGEIRRAIRFINENLGNNRLKVQTVADEVGLSYTWFSTLFKNETGQTFNSYLLNARIEYAKHLLQNSGCKMYEVAEQTGFGNVQYFSKVFKDIVGQTPKDYYRNHSK